MLMLNAKRMPGTKEVLNMCEDSDDNDIEKEDYYVDDSDNCM